MKQINVSTLEEVRNIKKRIGDNVRSLKTETSVDIERRILTRGSPLPLTFDIRPVHEPFFSEYTYTDCFGGIVLAAMSPEVTARALDFAARGENIPVVHDHCKEITSRIFDKYVLDEEKVSFPQAKKIMFMPGANLFPAMEMEFVERLMFDTEDIFLKPHPITADLALRDIGIRFGYHRIIPRNESGIRYLNQADFVFVTCNSEIGIMAAAMGKPFLDFTSFRVKSQMTYWPMYRLFTDNIDHNRAVINKLLSSKGSGWIMPWMDDVEERAAEFFKRTMEIRAMLRPLAPKCDMNRLASARRANPPTQPKPENKPPEGE